MIPDEARSKIVRESMAALSDVLAGVSPKMRKRIVACVVERVEAQGMGYAMKAESLGRALALDIKTAQKIAARVAMKRGLRIAAIVAGVVATNLPALAGAALAAIAAFVETDVDESES